MFPVNVVIINDNNNYNNTYFSVPDSSLDGMGRQHQTTNQCHYCREEVQMSKDHNGCVNNCP